jgi:hypothetical protein
LPAAAPLPLPPNVVDVRFENGYAAVLSLVDSKAQSPSRYAVSILNREGKLVRPLMPGAGVKDLRTFEVLDFAVAPGSIPMAVGIGGYRGGVAQFSIVGAEQMIPLVNVRCYLLSVDAASEAWCLGPGNGRDDSGKGLMLLHRFSRSGRRTSYLSLESLMDRRMRGEVETLPWTRGRTGRPALFSTPGHLVWVWLPTIETLIRFDSKDEKLEFYSIPIIRAGRSVISLTVLPEGRIIALLPMRKGSAEESLDTPYCFFEMKPGASQWKLLDGMAAVKRGSRIVGAEPGQVVVWARGGHLEFHDVP